MAKKRSKYNTTSPISLGGILIFIVVIIFASFSSYTLFLTIFGMLPGIIAFIVDKYPERYLSRIVLLFNFSGVIRYLITIFSTPEKAQAIATKFILDPMTWLYIYSYSAIGWVVFWGFPNINVMLHSLLNHLKTNRLNDELDALTEEWGKDIKKTLKD